MTITEEIKAKIKAAAKENRILCPEAWRIAEENSLSPGEINGLLNDMGIKIIRCRLGCF